MLVVLVDYDGDNETDDYIALVLMLILTFTVFNSICLVVIVV